MHCILSALVFNVEDLTHHYSTGEGGSPPCCRADPAPPACPLPFSSHSLCRARSLDGPTQRERERAREGESERERERTTEHERGREGTRES